MLLAKPPALHSLFATPPHARHPLIGTPPLLRSERCISYARPAVFFLFPFLFTVLFCFPRGLAETTTTQELTKMSKRYPTVNTLRAQTPMPLLGWLTRELDMSQYDMRSVSARDCARTSS